ncbi:unnamed protein product [Cuscuta europaea]|uniref:TTF-type domain-containing protein n=1 Tax=Cuscuta europaea TaxID=41803 RepID=A0A9P1EM15_CUSEU|nr:unnamed protein product [Cuscuta europaea]
MTTPQQPPKKAKVGKSTLHSYFTSNAPTTSIQTENPISNEHEESSNVQNQASSSVIEIERDPGKRRKICDWPVNNRDEVRRLYLVAGPYQPKLQRYQGREYKDKIRRFQPNWFNEFNWLEYSPTRHKAYCFPCFLFCDNIHASNTSALVHIGFDSWKRVHQGKECVFFLHTGTSPYSYHNKCVTYATSLMTPAQHIDKVIERNQVAVDLEHYYRFEYFTQSIDYQVAELNSRFCEKSVRLLELSVALDPRNSFESFNADHIYNLAVEFYPDDFEQHERNALKSELTFYHIHVAQNTQFQVPTLSHLCEMLVKTRKADDFKMLTRLIRLVLTLPVSTATTERAFSAMKHVKTAIRNKMADEFLADSLTIFIERELVSTIDIDSLIDEFAKVKDRRVQLTF